VSATQIDHSEHHQGTPLNGSVPSNPIPQWRFRANHLSFNENPPQSAANLQATKKAPRFTPGRLIKIAETTKP
jgi:hypothetical protein